MCEGDNVTRYLRGKNVRLKVTLPSVRYDQSILKALWESHQDIAKEYMKVSALHPISKEVKKLEKETKKDDAAFDYVKRTILGAFQGRPGQPTIKREEPK